MTPELSVVLPTDRHETIAGTIESLRRQSKSGSIELVIVTPDPGAVDQSRPELEEFAGVKVVGVSHLDPLAAARAAGIRAAASPVVAIGETHAYPQPGWAEAMIDAHRDGWAAVGPAMANANPNSLISWSNLFLDYGPWVELAEAGAAQDVPVHNSSFKRDVLLEYGPGLEEALNAELWLVEDLMARGHRLFLQPAARTAHLNVSRPLPWLRERFHAGRRFAAVRAEPWPLPKRLGYIAGAPAIPLLRLRRILPIIRRSARTAGLLPRILPVLLVSLAASALGEMFGYAFGEGGSADHCHEIELHRTRYA